MVRECALKNDRDPAASFNCPPYFGYQLTGNTRSARRPGLQPLGQDSRNRRGLRQRSAGKQRQGGTPGWESHYLGVNLFVDGAFRLLLLLHSQQVHQGANGHPLGRRLCPHESPHPAESMKHWHQPWWWHHPYPGANPALWSQSCYMTPWTQALQVPPTSSTVTTGDKNQTVYFLAGSYPSVCEVQAALPFLCAMGIPRLAPRRLTL